MGNERSEHGQGIVLGYAGKTTGATPRYRAALRMMIVWGVVDALAACFVGIIGLVVLLVWLNERGIGAWVGVFIGAVMVVMGILLMVWSISCFVLRQGMVAREPWAFGRAIKMAQTAIWAIWIVGGAVMILVGVGIGATGEWAGLIGVPVILAVFGALATMVDVTAWRLRAAKWEIIG